MEVANAIWTIQRWVLLLNEWLRTIARTMAAAKNSLNFPGWLFCFHYNFSFTNSKRFGNGSNYSWWDIETIDDYAENGGPVRSDFYVVFTMSLCALGLKQLLISLLFQIIRLWLGVHALRNYLKLICEYERHSLLNEKVSGATVHGKNNINVRPHLVRHLLRNRLLQLTVPCY